MFNPDLGYYFRAIRNGKRLIATGFILGALAGLLLGVLSSGGHWEANQQIRIDKTAISPALDDEGFISITPLPDRKVLDEAAVLRLVSDDLSVPSSIIVLPDEQAGSIELSATSSSRATATADLKQLTDAYREDRIADYDQRLAAAIAAVSAQEQTSQASLDRLDAEIAATPPNTGVLAQALVAQRADIADVLASSVGARAYLTAFRAEQNGGITLSENPEVSQQPQVGSGLSVAAVLGVLGAICAAVVVLVRRTARRRIESPADLALYDRIVSLGELDGIDPLVLNKVANADSSEIGSGTIFIIESLVGEVSAKLRDQLAAHGIEVVIRSCLHLPVLRADDRVVLAIDRNADTEKSVDDLLELLSADVPLPVLAVLC